MHCNVIEFSRNSETENTSSLMIKIKMSKSLLEKSNRFSKIQICNKMKAYINAVQILIFELSTPFFSGSPPLPPLSLSCYYGSEQRFFVGFSKERSREGVLQNCTHGCLLKNNF